jgi:hypothetical protein
MKPNASPKTALKHHAYFFTYQHLNRPIVDLAMNPT